MSSTTEPRTGTRAGTPTRPSPTRGSLLLPALTIAAPLTVAAAVGLHPDDTQGAGHALAHIAGEDRLLWTVTHLLEPFGWLLVGATLLLALPRLAPGRGRPLVTTGAVLAAIGYASLAFIVYGHGEAFLMMTTPGVDSGAVAPLFEQYEVGMPLAGPLALVSKVGLLVAGIGLLRARTVPRWAAALLVVAAVIPMNGTGMPFALAVLVLFGPQVAACAGFAPRLAASGNRVLPTSAA